MYIFKNTKIVFGLPHKPDVLPRNRKGMERWRFAIWNVGLMAGRGRELVMGKRNIDVMCVHETKWRVMRRES